MRLAQRAHSVRRNPRQNGFGGADGFVQPPLDPGFRLVIPGDDLALRAADLRRGPRQSAFAQTEQTLGQCDGQFHFRRAARMRLQ